MSLDLYLSRPHRHIGNYPDFEAVKRALVERYRGQFKPEDITWYSHDAQRTATIWLPKPFDEDVYLAITR